MTNRNNNKSSRKTDLVLIFMVPIVVMALAMAAIYFQRGQASPKYSFIYASCEDYRPCDLDYKYDEAGYISSFQVAEYTGDYKLYLYDIKSNESIPISLNKAGKYKLNSSEKSPDGYVLSEDSDSMRFMFWSDNASEWYLRNGSKKKLVELVSENNDISPNIDLVGWVIE